MKLLLACCTLVAAFAAVSLEEPEFYKTANDFLDMQAVVDDPAKLKAMNDCFLDKGPCDEVAQSYKVLAPKVIAESCKKCNAAQKRMSRVYHSGLKEKSPEEHEKFWAKYDPEGKYYDSFMKAVNV